MSSETKTKDLVSGIRVLNITGVVLSTACVLMLVAVVIMTGVTLGKVNKTSTQSGSCPLTTEIATTFMQLQSVGDQEDAFNMVDDNFFVDFHCRGIPWGGRYSGFEFSGNGLFVYFFYQYLGTTYLNVTDISLVSQNCDTSTFTFRFRTLVQYRCGPSESVGAEMCSYTSANVVVSPSRQTILSLEYWENCFAGEEFFEDTCDFEAAVSSASVSAPTNITQAAALGRPVL